MLQAHCGADRFLVGAILDSTQEAATTQMHQQIGNYKLLQKIGEGGFGIVYMAEQLKRAKSHA